MYRFVGCIVVWGFALLGVSEWYSRTYNEDKYSEKKQNNSKQ